MVGEYPFFIRLYFHMKIINYGMCVSPEWNACLFLEFSRVRNSKVRRVYGKLAMEMAERALIPKKLKEIYEIQKTADELYQSKLK